MAKNWEESLYKKIKSATEYSGIVRQVLVSARQKVQSGLKKSAYWSSIFVIGLFGAAAIMHFSGVPITEVAHADAPSWIIALVGNLIYYVFIAPIGVAAAVMAFILQIMINYPHGTFWNLPGVGSQGAGANAGGFVNVSAVITGWQLVRDVCNLFFSLILIIIALATVLKIEAYSWKTMVPKLVLMAVLINFSKSIAGVFTDFATVAMATFGGSFGSSFGSGLIGAFGLQSLTGLRETPVNESQNSTSVVGAMLAYVAAAVMVMVFFVVMVVFTLTLIFRIIMLWFLIVLSPLAYVTRILPQTQKYSSQWWEMFGRYVLVGPLVTFFLWLSLSIAFGTGEISAGANGGAAQGTSPLGAVQMDSAQRDAALTSNGQAIAPRADENAANPNVMANFMIALMMLMASLKLINQLATEFGGVLSKVEGAAWGAGNTMLMYSGRLMQKYGSKMGSKDGGMFSRAAYATTQKFAGGAIGKLMTFAGSTLFDPVEAGKGILKGLKESSDTKKQNARATAIASLQAMRGEFGVEGSKDPNKLTKLMGIIGGAGMDGKHVFDNYLSAGGLYQGHKYRSRQSEWNELPGLETEARALAAASKEEHTKFTAEELVTATADLQNLEKTIKNIDTNLGLGDDAKVDFGTETGQGIGLSIIANLQSELEQLQGLDNTAEASAVQGQITLLQSAMASKATQTKRELSNLTGAAATPEQDAQRKTANEKMIDEGLAGRRSTLQSEADGIRRGMDATGVAVSFDAAGNITVAGGEVTTKEKKNDAAEAANKARSNVNRLYREKGALMPGQSYEARVEKNRLVGEEMNKIKDILNTEELRGYMARAIEQKNRYMEKACRDRIMQLGDGNELLQDGTAHLWTPEMAGQPSEAGRSDAAGLHFYREHYLQGIMGMSEGEAMQEMNDSSYIGEGIGHLGIGRAFTMRAGRIRQLSESERAATCAGEKLKSSPSTWLDGNRLFVGYEDRNRDFHMSGHGITLLRQAGSALEADRLWERWNSNIKGKLSQPHIIDQLKREGIDAKLIIRLQKYYQQVGRFEGSDAPRRAGASRLARMAA